MTTQKQQELLLEEFIEKVKRDTYRKDDPYLLDDERPISTNRGNKLNRNAKFVRRGHLNSNTLFKQQVNHAGYQREVISINPQYFTPDGDEVDVEEEVREGDEPIDDNIYKDIKLEHLLAPLSNAAELPSHPSLSQPYKERGLEEMIRNAEEQLHKQQQVLYTIKNIYTGFRGDVAWAPMGVFRDAEAQRILNAGGADIVVQDEEDRDVPMLPATVSQRSHEPQNQQPLDTPVDRAQQQVADSTRNGAGVHRDAAIQSIERTDHAAANGDANDVVPLLNGVAASGINGIHPEQPAQNDESTATADESVEDTDSAAPPHRMTTRRQANNNGRSPTPAIPSIDAFFGFPADAVPDPRMGLPQNMADEATLALSTYISKQEEIVRQLQELHSGLLRALKMRQNVWKWCRAEGHVGEMSDNEDWVDFEEWDIDPRDTRIKYTKGQQEEDQVDEEEERRGKRVRRAGRQKE